MTSGGQCVMTTGTTLMLLWSASSWDMHSLEVRMLFLICVNMFFNFYIIISNVASARLDSSNIPRTEFLQLY